MLDEPHLSRDEAGAPLDSAATRFGAPLPLDARSVVSDEQIRRNAVLRAVGEAVARARLIDHGCSEPEGRRPFETAARHELFEAARFLYAIVETGDYLRDARDFAGEPALRLDRRSQLLEAIDKTRGCPTFSDLGRALHVTRQADVTLVGRTITTVMTLSNRDEMGFRMLIGREALERGFLVDSSTSYAGGRPRRAVRRKNWGK